MTTASQTNTLANKTAFLPRIAQDDKTAAKECVEFYGAMIWALAKQTIESNSLAEKAVQEIFLDIWENAQFCCSENYSEEVWIAMIAQRRLEKYSL